jgi:uncharacterized protein (DUF1697 family)
MRYVALIRAINVGGHSVIKMADLRRLVESLGFEDVSTYIQTGNVLFKSAESNRGKLTALIEEGIEAETGYKTTVFVRTPDELQTAADNNPFNPEVHEDYRDFRSHIIFLSAEPSQENIQKIMAIEGSDYKFTVKGRVFYYAYHRKYEGHTRRNINFEKVLGETGTARTYKVVDKLIELAAGL